MPGSRTWILAALLGLVLPGVLLVASLWIERGGLLDALQEDEAREIQARLGEAVGAFRQELDRSLADSPALILQLDAEGSPERPFTLEAEDLLALLFAQPSRDKPPLLQAAERFEQQEQPERAAALFAMHAQQSAAKQESSQQSPAQLPPSSILSWARALAQSRGVPAARSMLRERVPPEDPRVEGTVPLRVLAPLLEIDLLLASRDPRHSQEAKAIAESILRGQITMPAKLAPSIASILRKRIPDLEPTALDRFVFAAQVAEQLSNGQLDQQGAATAKGELLAYRWRERAVACFATEFARVAIERSLPAPGPDLSVSLANSGEHDSTFRVHASWQSPLLSAPLQIVSHTDLPSERLASLARLLLWAAALGFVLGNFWLLQLVRRELRITRLKQDFVDLVSHELRTPLTAVSLKSEMLARGDVPIERQPDYARTLYGDVRRLAELVERILDFARLSKGRMPLSKCPTPARELLARALVAGRPALQMAAQRVQVHAERKLPTVEVDVEVLARALRNLLENAAKYAPSGSTVHVTASHEEDQLVIRIRDEGAELDRNELRTIFEPFRRGGAAGAKPGTGLGLAVVAQSVRAHGGQVSASLAHEGGAEFVVSIPIREDVA